MQALRVHGLPPLTHCIYRLILEFFTLNNRYLHSLIRGNDVRTMSTERRMNSPYALSPLDCNYSRVTVPKVVIVLPKQLATFTGFTRGVDQSGNISYDWFILRVSGLVALEILAPLSAHETSQFCYLRDFLSIPQLQSTTNSHVSHLTSL